MKDPDDSGEFDGGSADPFTTGPGQSLGSDPEAPAPKLTSRDRAPPSVPGQSLPPGSALGPSRLGPKRFCPLHGAYSARDEVGQCPLCAKDPVGSSASLRRVRVVTEKELAPEDETGDHQPTPVEDDQACPSCNTPTPLGDFRVESIGEVWEGPAAVWAEEGVCPTCWVDVMPEHVRDWSDGEWMAYHYESWRATVEAVHEIFVFDDPPQDGWLPSENRGRVVDIERTLSARREHLARSQQTMRELQSRYNATLTPPPFQMSLASGGQATDPDAVEALRAMREDSLAVRAAASGNGEAAAIDEWLEEAAETQKIRALRRTGEMQSLRASGADPVEDVPEEVPGHMPGDWTRYLPWAVGLLVAAAAAAWAFVLLT